MAPENPVAVTVIRSSLEMRHLPRSDHVNSHCGIPATDGEESTCVVLESSGDVTKLKTRRTNAFSGISRTEDHLSLTSEA